MAPFDEIEFAKKNKAISDANEKIKVKYCENVLYLVIGNPCNFEEMVRLLNMNKKRAQLTNAKKHLEKYGLIIEIKVGTAKQHGRYEPTKDGLKYYNSLNEKSDI